MENREAWVFYCCMSVGAKVEGLTKEDKNCVCCAIWRHRLPQWLEWPVPGHRCHRHVRWPRRGEQGTDGVLLFFFFLEISNLAESIATLSLEELIHFTILSFCCQYLRNPAIYLCFQFRNPRNTGAHNPTHGALRKSLTTKHVVRCRQCVPNATWVRGQKRPGSPFRSK